MYTFTTEAVFPNIFKLQLFEPIIQKHVNMDNCIDSTLLYSWYWKKDEIHLILKYNVLLY